MNIVCMYRESFQPYTENDVCYLSERKGSAKDLTRPLKKHTISRLRQLVELLDQLDRKKQ